jgi:hypothetical protein
MTTKKIKSLKASLPKKSAKRKSTHNDRVRPPRQSSPITIGGGGSVKLRFNEDWYRPGVAGGFLNASDELSTVLILDEDNELLHNLFREVERQNCTVIVHCKYRGQDSTIEIDSAPGGPLAVRFDLDQYPYDRIRKARYNGNRKIKDPVEVVNKTTNTTTSFAVPSNGKCAILLIDQL